jgi:transposase-like protein
MTKADKRIEWKAKFDAWKASGLSVAAWCREQEINTPQMYYWVRNFDDEQASVHRTDTQWLTVNMKDEPTNHPGQEPVFIHFGKISVEVRQGANMELLTDVVRVLKINDN